MLYERRAQAMQRIADHARYGFVHHTQGQVPRRKWPRLQAKFCHRYQATDDRSVRRRYRRHGIAPSLLVAQHDPYYETVWWWLLVTDKGLNLAHSEETMYHIQDRQHRVTYGPPNTPLYEMLQVSGKWSWRMARSHVAEWEARIHEVVTLRSLKAAKQRTLQAHYSLAKVPGFRGIRQDAFQLQRLLRKKWRRHWSNIHPLPAQVLNQHRIRYVRRLRQR